MRKAPDSVRPLNNSVCGSGPSTAAEDGKGIKVERAHESQLKAVHPVEDGDERAEQLEAVDEEEDATCPPCLPTPYQPTRSEYLDHCVTHYLFRAWCRHCLEGRGREFGHSTKSGDKEPGAAPVVSFDYAFVGDNGEIATQEEFESAGEGAVKILVIRDSRSKAVFAHVVPVKGVDEKGFAVDALVADVKWLGYSKVTLKSDNEPAVVKLLAEALRELRVQPGVQKALEEHSPEYDPKQEAVQKPGSSS